MAGRKVFVYVTSELLDQLGTSRTADHDDFVKAVLTGPPWAYGDGVCHRALGAFREWRRRGLQYPPYIAYLGLFTLAAGLEGDFAPHAYYPRLRTLIGEKPLIGEYPHYSYMHFLWEDLERWSLEDKGGTLGIFNVILASKMRHVGIPMAQTLLSEAEVGMLAAVFARAGLDPTSLPSGENLASSVRVAAGHDLRPRTVALLGSEAPHAELREALIQILTDELLAWDGTVPPEEPGAEPAPAVRGTEVPPPDQTTDRELTTLGEMREPETRPSGRVFGTLRLICHFDRVAGHIHVGLVCRSAHAFPDEGLVLRRLGHQGSFVCDELAAGWSTSLRVDPNGRQLDAATLDWTAGTEVADEAGLWHFRLQPGPVRVLVNAQSLGMPGLIEEMRLPPALPFYVAARGDCAARIARWGAESCDGFREFPGVTGLPAGWRFFYADQANGDEQVRESFPILALPRSASLQFEGGLRVGGLNQFFDFAPPRVVVSGVAGDSEVVCNGVQLPTAGAGLRLLPHSLPKNSRLIIEVLQKGEAVARKNLWLVGPGSWPLPHAETRFDVGGILAAFETKPAYAGALVDGVEDVRCVLSPALDFTRCARVILLGRVPGQIANCPADPVPTTWSPVWRVEVRGKKLDAYYAGAGEDEFPLVESGTYDRRSITMWKEVMWHRRRRIRPPSEERYRRLWKSYQTKARDV
jgi:hypothetical protein